MKIVKLIQGSKEWLEWRQNGIGSSDVSVIVESNPYKTRLQLWENKCGFKQNEKINEAMAYGMRTEEIARNWINQNFEYKFVPICAEDDKVNYFHISLDGYDFIKKTFKKLKPKALITRDSDAFKNYSDDVKQSFNGIDCGFFINDWFNPPKIKDSFIACSFDKISEPVINTSNKIIRLHHHQFAHKEEFFQKPNTLISDNVKDYLTIYSNAIETHSDRVHACVASLSYSTPARLYFRSPRAKLFKKVTKKDIANELVKLDRVKINNLKREQIKIIKEVFQVYASSIVEVCNNFKIEIKTFQDILNKEYTKTKD